MLAGNGTLTGTLLNHGTVAPGGGGAIGRLTVQGNYTQSSTGSLTVELQAANSFDQLATNGTASLNGRLNIRLLNGFSPPLASTYDVVTAQTPGSSGSFSSVDPPPSFNLTLPVGYPGGGTTAARITTEPPIPTPIPQPWVPPSPTPAATPAAVVLPEICKVAPTSAGCQMALSPSNFTPAVQQIVQTVDTVVNQVPSARPAIPPRTSQSSELTPEQVAAMPASIPAAGSSDTSSASGKAEKKSEAKEDLASVKTVAKVEPPPPKTFCN